MTGPVEGTIQVATSAIDSLKSQPLSLALVIMNLVLLAYMFFEAQHVHNSRLESVKMILDVQKEVNTLLSQCAIRGKTDGTWETIPLPRGVVLGQ
jgi:hypothetical protein